MDSKTDMDDEGSTGKALIEFIGGDNGETTTKVANKARKRRGGFIIPFVGRVGGV